MKKASKDHLLVLRGYSNPVVVNIYPYLIVFGLDSNFYLSFIWGVFNGILEKTEENLFFLGLNLTKT